MKKFVAFALFAASAGTLIGCAGSPDAPKKKLPMDRMVDELVIVDEDSQKVVKAGYVTMRIGKERMVLVPGRPVYISGGETTTYSQSNSYSGYCKLDLVNNSANVISLPKRARLKFEPSVKDGVRDESWVGADGYSMVANYRGRRISLNCYKSDGVSQLDYQDFMSFQDLRSILGKKLRIARVALPRGRAGGLDVYAPGADLKDNGGAVVDGKPVNASNEKAVN